MAIEDWIKMAEVFVSLIQAIIWPVVLLVIILYFKTSLKSFISNIGEFNLKAGSSGIEATAKRQQIEAAAMLGAASARKSNELEGDQEPLNEDKVREIASLISDSVTSYSASRKLNEASVLWVDDRPENNIFERKSLEALGIRFTISKSTGDALEKLRLHRFEAIISDMGRPPDPMAGYTLLDALRKSNIKTPFIIYAGSNKPEHKEEAKRRGAQGSTNNPKELFQLIIAAILNSY
ncbi:MAG TPA: response regulator [candidate division Zixibacteria bacterium]|nr:response regulator [candidate division Zixibacteria bacterium]